MCLELWKKLKYTVKLTRGGAAAKSADRTASSPSKSSARARVASLFPFEAWTNARAARRQSSAACAEAMRLRLPKAPSAMEAARAERVLLLCSARVPLFLSSVRRVAVRRGAVLRVGELVSWWVEELDVCHAAQRGPRRRDQPKLALPFPVPAKPTVARSSRICVTSFSWLTTRRNMPPLARISSAESTVAARDHRVPSLSSTQDLATPSASSPSPKCRTLSTAKAATLRPGATVQACHVNAIRPLQGVG